MWLRLIYSSLLSTAIKKPVNFLQFAFSQQLSIHKAPDLSNLKWVSGFTSLLTLPVSALKLYMSFKEPTSCTKSLLCMDSQLSRGPG